MKTHHSTLPLSRLVVTPGNPLPEGTTCGTIETADGIGLRCAVFGAARASRGTICIFQGRGDFIERYFETAADLEQRGFATAIFDMRGQGGSQRLTRNPFKGHVRDFRDFDRDVEAFMSKVVMPDCPPPYFALGHSTGANVLLRALRHHNWFEAAILSAPLIGFGRVPFPEPVIRIVARLAVWTGFATSFALGQRHRPWGLTDFPGNPLTSDLQRYTRDLRPLEAEPAIGLGGPTYGWIHAACRSMTALRRLKGHDALRSPVMVVAGGADRVVSLPAIMALVKRLPGTGLVVVENARHELLIERDEMREQFWAAFDSFVDARSPQAHDPVARAMASA